MSATLVSPQEQELSLSQEHYGISMTLVRETGRLALEGANAEFEQALEQLRGEFRSTLFEGLKSDKEFGDSMQVEDFQEWEVKDGTLLSKDGKTAIVDLLANGLTKSTELAEQDPRMQNQAIRDQNDIDNALQVEQMIAGTSGYNTRVVISAYPKTAMDRDGDEYWNEVGYIRGLNYIQIYHARDNGSLVTGAVSFEAEPEKIAEVLADFGVSVPEDESPDNYINYAITGDLTLEQAKDIGTKVRLKAEGEHSQKVNAVDVLDANGGLEARAFESMVVPMTKSLFLGRKTYEMSTMIDAWMKNSMSFSPEVRAGLLKAHNRAEFDIEDARLVWKLSAYSTIESLRQGISRNSLGQTIIAPIETSVVHGSTIEYQQRMASMASVGAQAGRSYGGCGALIKMSDKTEVERKMNPQNVFGGTSEEKMSDNEDEYGPLVFECTEGHTNTRERGKLLTKCQHKDCSGTVGC